VGGGVIGLSTAYYLASSQPKSSPPECIYVVDSSLQLFAAASGGATGILGNYGFKPEADALGKLSWDLHKQLAADHGGRREWGFSCIVIRKMHYKDQIPSPAKNDLAEGGLPSWFKNSEEYANEIVANHTSAARM